MISVCIIVKDGAATLEETLKSVQSFPEVLLLDNGSSDETLAIAGKFANVRIDSAPFLGFGRLRNLAARKARYDWILALDADEVLTGPVKEELKRGFVYSFPFHNFYKGQRIYGCGWNPERHVRLYHRGDTSFSEAQVHEGVKKEGLQEIPLPLVIGHTPYRSVADFLRKMQHYSHLFAEEYRGKRGASFGTALLHGAAAFFKSYFLKRGIFDGQAGFEISFYNGATAFYKYLKLAEANQRCS